MNNPNLLISWIIIGRNWSDTIDELTNSLNSQNINPDLVELIIIDDASQKGSQGQFDQINFSNKKIIILDEQSGRSSARNQGINKATGTFCLFTNSNVIPMENFINKYIDILSTSKMDGAAGIINYTSKDKYFENYLNHEKRGLKQFNNNDILPIEYVLFGNCAIRTSYIKAVNGFNEQLAGYGGEELELLDRIAKNINDLKILKVDTVVVRMNHPNFDSHRMRLIEFGETNFKLLSKDIQRKIIPIFNLTILIGPIVSIIYEMLLIINRILQYRSFLLMKILMGLSILKGYKN